MSADGQRTKWCRNTAENFNRLSSAHERYRQTDDRQTDGRAMTYRECEREFTFAKNCLKIVRNCRENGGIPFHFSCVRKATKVY